MVSVSHVELDESELIDDVLDEGPASPAAAVGARVVGGCLGIRRGRERLSRTDKEGDKETDEGLGERLLVDRGAG